MTTTPKTLFQSKFAEAAEAKQYPLTQADSVRTAIDKFTAHNVSAGNVTLTVRLVAADGAAGAANAIVRKTIAPNATYTFPELVGHNIEPGDFVSTLCDTADALVIRASGRQYT